MKKEIDPSVYQDLAQRLIDSNFFVCGVGNFDVTKSEVATILKILIEGGDLFGFYEKLEEERMG